MSSWWTCDECGEEWYGSGHRPCPNKKKSLEAKAVREEARRQRALEDEESAEADVISSAVGWIRLGTAR